jgi:hypothetical protein
VDEVEMVLPRVERRMSERVLSRAVRPLRMSIQKSEERTVQINGRIRLTLRFLKLPG